MRLKILLAPITHKGTLPIDYQYFIGSWIYKTIERSDKSFASFLHNKGYGIDHRTFKFFCYSPLRFNAPIRIVDNSFIEVSPNSVTLQIAFALADAAELFISALKTHSTPYIGSCESGTRFAIEGISMLSEPSFQDSQAYKATSPIVISKKSSVQFANDYLSPQDEDYCLHVEKHLLAKYNNLPLGSPISSSIRFESIPNQPVRSKLITICPNSEREIKVKGYTYSFCLNAPPEIHHMLWCCGIGEKNSMGFGWVEPQ